MKKLNISVVIPTRNRYQKLIKTINYLSKNSFFFREIIIVDSSDKKAKDVKRLKNKYKNLKIKIFQSKPSISLQRNIGLNKVKKNTNYIMFLDDDVKFEKKSFKIMRDFLNNNKKYSGIGFNLIIKNTNQIFEKFKRSKIFQLLDTVLYGKTSDALNQYKELYDLGCDVVMVFDELLNTIHFLTQLKIAPQLKDDILIPESERNQGLELAKKIRNLEFLYDFQKLKVFID